jgi:hypothetical protein
MAAAQRTRDALTSENLTTVRNLVEGVAPMCSPCLPVSSGEAGWDTGSPKHARRVNGGTTELPGGAPVFSNVDRARRGSHQHHGAKVDFPRWVVATETAPVSLATYVVARQRFMATHTSCSALVWWPLVMTSSSMLGLDSYWF